MIICKATAELSPKELFTIFQKRVEVFVVEQQCPYQEVDAADRDALHVCLIENGILKAYARIIAGGTAIHFGRVLVAPGFRRSGLGQKIVAATLKEIAHRFPDQTIAISAQVYLIDFYASFGFVPTSGEYLEDGIPHIDMVKKAA